MVKPAPIVEAAVALEAKPRASPIADAPLSSSKVHVDAPTNSGAAYADPPTESGSLMDEPSGGTKSLSVKQQEQSTNNNKLSVDELRASAYHTVLFESEAGVIIGQAEKSFCQRLFPLFFDERVFLSYGEVKRYILLTTDGIGTTIFVYVDITDPTPLYIIELIQSTPTGQALLMYSPVKEDRNNPEFYSHTISPEANTGIAFQENKSRESLESVLLKKGKDVAFQFAFDKSKAGGEEDVCEKFIAAVMSSSKGCNK